MPHRSPPPLILDLFDDRSSPLPREVHLGPIEQAHGRQAGVTTRYIGGNIVHVGSIEDGKEWGRESELAYVVQTGPHGSRSRSGLTLPAGIMERPGDDVWATSGLAPPGLDFRQQRQEGPDCLTRRYRRPAPQP